MKNLTNQKFGKLTVIRKTDKQDKWGNVIWECLCDCGNTHYATTASLLKGKTKSCGCMKYSNILKINKNKIKNIKGQKFGRLTVVEKTEQRANGHVVWKCQCECGNIINVSSQSLISGNTKSCGCLFREVNFSNENIKRKGFIEGTSVAKLKSKKLSSNNTSGYKGVSWNNANKKWYAYIKFKMKMYNLGNYEDIKDAIKARKNAEQEIFGDFLKWYEEECKK